MQVDLSGNGVKQRPYERRKFLSEGIRKKILEHDNYCCRMCLSKENVEIHELTPQSLGGELSLDNCFTLCYRCHVYIHNAPYFKLFKRKATREGLKKAKNVGKRGKDKKPRRRDGYIRRWQNHRIK